MTVSEGAAGLLELVFPRACVHCDGAAGPHILCAPCWSRLPLLAAPRCERCGHPNRGRACTYCDALPPFVRAVRSVCWVPDPVSSAAVQALKYDGWVGVAAPMADRMARLAWPADVLDERAAVIPVPLAAARRRERGYNQAEALANEIGARWGIPCWADIITRERNTPTQTRLTPSERSMNVHRAFRVNEAARGVRQRISGAHIVLVDDVLTTGATLNAAATELFHAGARIVSYVTFGRARTAAD
jgi:ComF family protein